MAIQHPTRIAPLLLALGAGLLLAVSPAAGTERDASVGAEGELYFVREGTYGELFPQDGLADAANSVLALEVVRSDQTRERLLVPGTETADSEDSASILFEDQSGTLFVLWQTKSNVIHSRLSLIGLRGGEWTAPIEISGNPFGWKSSPQLAVTRDTFRTEESDGSLRTWARTVAHLLWWEDGPAGNPVAHYSPVTLLDGVYTGWNPVYTLDGLALAPKAWGLPGVNAALARAPRIASGHNGQSVVIAYVSAETGDLITVSAETLPGEIAAIADEIRHQIIDVGRELLPDKPAALADKVRHQIIDVGRRLALHPSVPAYAAQQAASEILASPPGEDLASLAERVRHQIIDVGGRMTDRGLDRTNAASKLQILETSNEGTGAPPNLIRWVEASVRPAPQTGERDNAIFLSRGGREVVVSWTEGGVVYYRESRGAGWSPTRTLRLGSELDAARARQILARRAAELSDE